MLRLCAKPASISMALPPATVGIRTNTSSIAYHTMAKTIIIRAGRISRLATLIAMEPASAPIAKLATR